MILNISVLADTFTKKMSSTKSFRTILYETAMRDCIEEVGHLASLIKEKLVVAAKNRHLCHEIFVACLPQTEKEIREENESRDSSEFSVIVYPSSSKEMIPFVIDIFIKEGLSVTHVLCDSKSYYHLIFSWDRPSEF